MAFKNLVYVLKSKILPFTYCHTNHSIWCLDPPQLQLNSKLSPALPAMPPQNEYFRSIMSLSRISWRGFYIIDLALWNKNNYSSLECLDLNYSADMMALEHLSAIIEESPVSWSAAMCIQIYGTNESRWQRAQSSVRLQDLHRSRLDANENG